MASLFENVQPGDQVELPARRIPWLGQTDTRNPDRPARVAVVTHRWFDPVERKEYVGLAMMKADGTCGDPTEKRTIRGLAQAGWRPASQDWIAYAKAVGAGEVIQLHSRR